MFLKTDLQLSGSMMMMMVEEKLIENLGKKAV